MKEKRISYETIYAYIYVLPRGSLKKELIANLRQERKYRRSQKRGVKSQKSIENMLSIHERPEEVKDRIISGH
jgi:IS30 family transposase